VLPEWPGVPASVAEARADPDSQAGIGIDQVIEHHAAVVEEQPEPPVLIGHSFGGMVVQALLARGLGRAGVAIDPAPIRGVVRIPPAQVRATFPVLRNPGNRSRSVSLTPEQFRRNFANAVSADEAAQLQEKWTIPGPARPLFQAAMANAMPKGRAATAVDTRKADRAPLLIVAGGADRTVPGSVSKAAHKLYRKSSAVTDLIEFPDRGHSLVVDSGWPEVAQAVLEWLARQGIHGRAASPSPP
jgi:pimeloyl-ACP methyl ester carboxylesterase